MTRRDTLTTAEAAFVRAQRVGRLSTADQAGRTSVVPVCYAFDGAHFYTPLDEKPKSVAVDRLRRVRNIMARHEASLLIDRYDDDWSRLGYVLVHGRADLLAPGEEQRGTAEHARAVSLLRERYVQYRAMNLEAAPVIALTPDAVSSWGPSLQSPREPGDEAEHGETIWTAPGRGVDVLSLAQGRRSVRAYDGRPVPRAALEEVLETARWAPSPHGLQPWRFAVLTRDEPKRRLAAAMGAEWERTLELDEEPPEIVRLRLDKSRERIVTAPALVLACLYLEELDRYPDPVRQRAEETMAVQSLGAAVQNLLLAAYALGLDGGWMCAPLFCPDTVREALDLDASVIPHALLTLGYAARDPRRRPHRPLSELVVRFE